MCCIELGKILLSSIGTFKFGGWIHGQVQKQLMYVRKGCQSNSANAIAVVGQQSGFGCSLSLSLSNVTP